MFADKHRPRFLAKIPVIFCFSTQPANFFDYSCCLIVARIFLFKLNSLACLERLLDTTCPSPLIDRSPPYHLTGLQRDRVTSPPCQVGLLIPLLWCKDFLLAREHIHYCMTKIREEAQVKSLSAGF